MDGSPPPDEIEYLRRIAVASDFQTKAAKWALGGISFAIVMLLFCTVDIFTDIKELEKPVPSKPRIITLSDAYTQIREGNLPKALQSTDEVLKRNPRDYDAHYYKGQILLMQGDIDGAVKSFFEAKNIFPLPRYEEAFQAAASKQGRPVRRLGE
jgi:tetratricopeptide (TPR) repeat protein